MGIQIIPSYMIALIPSKKTAALFIQTAQQLFSSISDGYLLTKESLPHITLCQFECEQKQTAQMIWQEVAHQAERTCSIRLIGVSFIKGIGPHSGFYWAELSVARDSELMHMHHLAATVTKSHRLTCLNEMGDLYRPHLTLARTRPNEICLSWSSHLLDPTDRFHLDFTPCASISNQII